ncbi:inorganic phosphate transporter [Candidatus Bathyarchaeota archaeon]|nr:inorganic phosphate transporter [Candidatus Bathyarchaeota archaeon]
MLTPTPTGANDVANSWATSVSSRSVGYIQAMCLASVLEFTGAIGVGARVADTIRTKIVDISLFEDDPALLMLGMLCAVVASSVYLTICTRMGLPVSTTHSIMGGVIGMGVALVGAENIMWVDPEGGINSGVIQVFLAWIIAPGLSGAFAAIIFMITKYAVMVRSNPVVRGLITVPIYFGFTASLLTMLLVWKGGSIEVNLNSAGIAGVIVGVGCAFAVVIGIFLVPWLYRIVVKDDWQLRWWQIPMGPLLLRRPEPPVQPAGASGGITDFYAGHLTKEELDSLRNRNSRTSDTEATRVVTPKVNNAETEAKPVAKDSEDGSEEHEPERTVHVHKSIVGPRPEGPWHSGAMLFWRFKWVFLRGVDQDVIASQNKESKLTGDLDEMHAHAKHYDNRAEYLYSFLQVLTASTASFAHGANDVANAIGPYATIFQIWNTGNMGGKKSEVPVWIL